MTPLIHKKDAPVYVACPKKGKPRKPIEVCRQCRYRGKCKPYIKEEENGKNNNI